MSKQSIVEEIANQIKDAHDDDRISLKIGYLREVGQIMKAVSSVLKFYASCTDAEWVKDKGDKARVALAKHGILPDTKS